MTMLRDRFSHLPPERRAKYQQMLDQSPRLIPDPIVIAPLKTDGPCIHRGDESGTCELRRCCGRPPVAPVPAWSCNLLEIRCVEFGQPSEKDVETCSMCGEFRHSK